MKTLVYCFTKVFATALIVIASQGCEKPEVVPPSPSTEDEIVLGELHEGEPVLTYPDYDRLKEAMKFAFPTSTSIDTVFLHKIDEGTGESAAYLTAVGTYAIEGEAPVTSSINFRFSITTGTIKWENPWDAFYCIPGGGCPGCIVQYRGLCACTMENTGGMPENYGCGRVDAITEVPYSHDEVLQRISNHLIPQ